MKRFSYAFFTTTASAWQAMLGSIQVARQSILWEVYAFVDDEAGRPFIDTLCERARAGVEVKLILDAFGSWALTRQSRARLEESGVELVWYNHPMGRFGAQGIMKLLFHRNHRKVLIVDRAVAFVGGVNIIREAASWDDLHLRLTGIMVRPLVAAFVRSFISAGGSRRAVSHLLRFNWVRRGWARWKNVFQIILHSPEHIGRRSRLRRWYREAISQARKKITVLSPYYVPDLEFMKLLTDARQRGVAVEVIAPRRSDHHFMDYMARGFYRLMHRAGAVLYFVDNMNHAKALVVDGSQAFIGSPNVTRRSLGLNEESGIVFSHNRMVRDLDRIINRWKVSAVRYTDTSAGTPHLLERAQRWLAGVLRAIV